MKRNKPYDNELFKASRLLNAFTVDIGDTDFVIVLGLSDSIYQYDEEGLITFCVSAVESFDFPAQIYKVEVSSDKEKTLVFISANDIVNNASIDRILETFNGKLIEPIEEVATPDGFITNITVVTELLNDYYRIRKK